MAGLELSIAITQLEQRVLSSVEFVQDYLQLRFDGVCLTAYTCPAVSVGAQRFKYGTPGYRDRLCEQIGSKVAHASTGNNEISVTFESGVVIYISLRSEDYVGPEAIQFTSEDGSIWVE